MSNISFNEFGVCPDLSVEEQRMVIWSRASKLKDLSLKSLQLELLPPIERAIFILGHKNVLKSNEELHTVVIILSEALMDNYGNITLYDIKTIINNGAMGEYTREGDITYLSIESINRWIKKYLEKKQEALRKQRAYNVMIENNKVEKLSKEKEDERLLQWALKSFDEYKEKNTYQDYGNIVYDYLVSTNKISFSDEVKKVIWVSEKNKLLKIHNPVIAVDTLERNEKRIAHNDIMQETPYWKTMIKINAKQAALNKFYHDMIEMGMELKDCINE